jgi:hypothetical protein
LEVNGQLHAPCRFTPRKWPHSSTGFEVGRATELVWTVLRCENFWNYWDLNFDSDPSIVHDFAVTVPTALPRLSLHLDDQVSYYLSVHAKEPQVVLPFRFYDEDFA